MPKANNIPTALTIAGSDSGGGAGVQADLKTFAAIGVHGTSAVTCITAQNPRRVSGIEPCSPAMVRKQIEAVFDGFQPRAVKTGMLYSAAIINEVARCLKHRRVPVVVDPVMVSTSRARLLESSALKALQTKLLPLASLVTPNLDEAAVLVGTKLRSVEDLRAAAREIHERFGCAVLVKGGHLKNSPDAVDIYFDGKKEMLLKARFIRGVSTHGTGCTFAAAIAAYLALDLRSATTRSANLRLAVARAKRYVTRAIAGSRRAGGFHVLNHFHH